MADVEMIFPEKKVFIKPFVLIQLVVTVVLAIITVVSTLLQVHRLSLCSNNNNNNTNTKSFPAYGGLGTSCLSKAVLCMHLTHIHNVAMPVCIVPRRSWVHVSAVMWMFLNGTSTRCFGTEKSCWCLHDAHDKVVPAQGKCCHHNPQVDTVGQTCPARTQLIMHQEAYTLLSLS